MSERRRVLLIDADILVYQVATSAEKPIDWGDDLWTLHSDMNEAVPEIERRIVDIKTALNADELVFALTTTERNFRKDVYAKYKDNRKATRKPLVWKPLREHLKATYTVFERSHLEGDDCLGILATKVWPGFPDRIIVSIDKDFKTIPCQYWNLSKPELGIQFISEDQADYWHLFQTLTGDPTDGYPGCPGIGPKSAEKLLQACWSSESDFDNAKGWQTVVAAYKAKGLGEGVALQMARCARILRASDYDFKNKKPILWEPTKGVE